MAKYYNSSDSQEDKNILWDLRQARAKLITLHMLDIYVARKKKDYIDWFESIESLYTIVEHVIKDKFKDIRLQYLGKRDVCLKVFNRYPQIYLGGSKEDRGIHYVDGALRSLERFLYRKMQLSGVFGMSDFEPGL